MVVKGRIVVILGTEIVIRREQESGFGVFELLLRGYIHFVKIHQAAHF